MGARWCSFKEKDRVSFLQVEQRWQGLGGPCAKVQRFRLSDF